MRRHTRPYRPKKQWRKRTSAKKTSFEMKVNSNRDGIGTTITYIVKASASKCSQCQCAEYGRVFKITEIKSAYSIFLDDMEPVRPDLKRIRKAAVGKNFCLACLPS